MENSKDCDFIIENSQENNHPSRKQVINRFSRLIGHTEAVKRMYVEGASCSDILVQIAAIKSAMNNVGKIILKDHINHCIVDAVNNKDSESLKSLNNAIDKFVK